MRTLTSVLIIVPLMAAGGTWAQAKDVSIRDAIDSALTANINARLAQYQQDSAAAALTKNDAAYLPDIAFSASQSRTFRENLSALMGAGGAIGPFSTFDMRVKLTQNIIDFSLDKRHTAAQLGTELAKHSLAAAKEQVAATAALYYVEAARTHRAVAAAQADYELAERLLRLAEHQHTNGLVTGLDVTRAKTRQSDTNVALLKAQSSERQAAIRLKRIAGWDMQKDIVLADDIDTAGQNIPGIPALLSSAMERPDMQMAALQTKIDEARLSASQRGRMPAVMASAEYGLSGNGPDNSSIPTGSVGIALAVPLFDGGKISGENAAAAAALAGSKSRLHDIRDQIEEDVRLSYEIAAEALSETAVAEQTVTLAEDELRMSQDRYAEGISDNVEVVTAQAELAKARDAYVSALARQQESRINLAAATGKAQSFSLR